MRRLSKISIRLAILMCWLVFYPCLQAQDSPDINTTFLQVPQKYLDKVSATSEKMERIIEKKSEKAIQRFGKLERKMKKKLAKIDSLAANNIFVHTKEKYKELEQRLQNGNLTSQYLPRIDSIVTSLKFLKEHKEFISQTKEMQGKLKESLTKIDALQNQLQKADEIKRFLKERKQILKEQLSKFGFAKELKKINKEAYYYARQINEYKETLNDSKKTERKVLELLSRTTLFQNFIKKNSILASLFPMPGGAQTLQVAQTGFAGLQTRSQMLSFAQSQSGMNASRFASVSQKNIQSAQGIIDQLRNKLNSYGSSSDLDMPDFKPNNQKTKSFWKRLEYGTNIQSQKSNYFFPTTTDIGLSIGYKLSDRSILGLGSSFKMGWGQNIRKIKVSAEGLSLRSFLDVKMKGSFFISGGFEYNYQQTINSLVQINNLNSWYQSGLLGISKVVSLKSKYFKKTKLQLLWDFLSYQQRPVQQPIKFRVGYSF